MRESKQRLQIRRKARELFRKHQANGQHEWHPLELGSEWLWVACKCGATIDIERIPDFESVVVAPQTVATGA